MENDCKLVKTTKHDFELFKKECQKWIDFFGINEWQIQFKHTELSGCDAQCKTHYGCKWSYLSLATEIYEYDYSETLIKSCAAEEVCHLLLSPLCKEAENRYITEGEIRKTEHEIIRRLINSLSKFINKS